LKQVADLDSLEVQTNRYVNTSH